MRFNKMKTLSALALGLLLVCGLTGVPQVFADAYSTYGTKVGVTQGGDTMFVKSGGHIVVQSGGDIDAITYKSNGSLLSNVRCVDSTVTAALLDSAGSVTVLPAGTTDQWKIRNIILTGGGTNYAAGGDRLISLTDGTTTWTTIANADIESVPSASLMWGNTKVPFLTNTSNTKSVANTAIVWKYSGGTTDHSATGSIVFTVCAEKTN